MAKMKIEFLRPLQEEARPHAQGPAGRPPARLRARGEPLALAAEPAQHACRALRWLGEKLLGLSAKRSLPRMAQRHLLARARRDRCSRAATGASPPPATGARSRCSSSTPSTAPSKARTPWPPRACSGRRLRCCTRSQKDGGHHCCGRTYLANGMVDEAKAQGRRADRCAAAVGRGRHRHRRPRALVPADAARRGAGRWAWAPRPQTVARPGAAVRGIHRARSRRPAASSWRSSRPASRSCCTATATRRPSAR